MIRIWAAAIFLLAALGASTVSLAANPEPASSKAPDFQEVYGIIKQNLAGATDQELNKAAVQGLVAELRPRVKLLTNDIPKSGVTNDATGLKTNLFDGSIAYVRVSHVADGVAKQVQQSFSAMGGAGKLKGLVLDLRFADGDDYGAAAATADLFIRKKMQLLKWGGGSAQSTEKSDAITVPIAALVNRDTSAAAEALAAVLRQSGAGLVLGSRTAGEAMIAKDFPLSNGDKLRIAVARIEVGDTATLSADGLKPDIQVDVPAEDERAYYADAFKMLEKPTLLTANTTLSLSNSPSSTTNRTRRPRFNEAELVRERREGATLESDAVAGREEPDMPIVHDPALARALDLLKGLAVVRHANP
jgi:hypothetical protein